MDNTQMDRTHYEIRVEGTVSTAWCEWFEGLSLREDDDYSILTIPANDPSLLHGVLAQIGNLHIQLISVLVVAHHA